LVGNTTTGGAPRGVRSLGDGGMWTGSGEAHGCHSKWRCASCVRTSWQYEPVLGCTRVVVDCETSHNHIAKRKKGYQMQMRVGGGESDGVSDVSVIFAKMCEDSKKKPLMKRSALWEQTWRRETRHLLARVGWDSTSEQVARSDVTAGLRRTSYEKRKYIWWIHQQITSV